MGVPAGGTEIQNGWDHAKIERVPASGRKLHGSPTAHPHRAAPLRWRAAP